MTDEIKLDDELEQSIKDIVKSCEDEDREIRRSMIRAWLKYEEFWHGNQFLFWSERNDCWRSPTEFNFGDIEDEENADQLGSFSDKVVDIFRAHGEAIIAALAAQVPSLRFLPDDADSPEDLATAKTYSRIAELVQRHNKAKLVFFRALFFLAIQGLVASYRYKDSDFKYGSVKVPVYGETEKEVPSYTCPNCDYTSDTNWQLPDQNTGQQQPMEYDPTTPQITPCPQCGSIDPPIQQVETKKVPVLMDEKELPKSRAKLDIFGPLHFKVQYNARNQTETPYLILYGDQSKDIVKSVFTNFIDEIDGEGLDEYAVDRFARSQYNRDENTRNYLVTVKKVWLRPACLYRECDKSKRDRLLKKFPNGARITLIGRNNIIVNVQDEDLDSRWCIGQAGLSTFIHSDPLLRPLVQIQEMRNQLVNLIMETINHGIPSDFADPEILNFDNYGRFECTPGFIYKTKPRKPGEAIGNSFYTSNRATLSREVALFLQQLDKDAQFCLGSFPSIYGGPSEGKSRTFSEYAASRQMALQRLSIVWTFLVDWWVSTIEGCVKMYIECLTEDEKFAKFESGNYVNVWIKQSELIGRVGGVEAEASESFPISLVQKKDLIMKLMELNNEYVNSVIFNPDNARMIQDCFALTELKVPGENQRIKQVVEIYELLNAGNQGQEPVPGMPDPMTGQPGPPEPFVQVDPLVDDHAVHIAAIKSWAVDSTGLDAKKSNPMGYQQVMAHLQVHEQFLVKQTLSMAGGTPPGQQPETSKVGPEG